MRRGAFLALALVWGIGCAHDEAAKTGAGAPAESADEKPGKVRKLGVEDLVVGTGEVAERGRMLTVHYTGWLQDGTKFDSSLDRNRPFEFQLGAGNVIQGWDRGMEGMKVGGKRRLTIPPHLGYGKKGAGGVIPPDAVLVFEVELLGVN